MVTVTLPDVWLLIAPCGCIDGIRRSVIEGRVVTASAEEAWEKFTARKRERDAERKAGYTCVAGTVGDWDRSRVSCPHDPPWGRVSASSSAGPES